MYESIIIRCLLAALGVAGVWVGWPRKALNPAGQTIAGIVFMCGMFALIAAVFAK
jgi:hypothetical protein